MRTIGVSAAGRPVGEFVPAAKLTFAKVEEMRRLHVEGGLTYTEIGKRFGVHRKTASSAINGITWAVPIARMVQQLEAEDVAGLSAGEGKTLLARKAGTTLGSAYSSMKKAGIAWDGNRRKEKHTHCKRGHALEGVNLIVRKNGTQQCRECERARKREWARKNSHAANCSHQ